MINHPQRPVQCSTLPTFKHVNVNKAHEDQLTLGQKIADQVATTMGSWRFIIFQSILLSLWVLLNSIAYVAHWDNYPFILLNLMLSFQAAYAAPIIMMSQNRQAQKDRIAAEHDYVVNVKAEQDILRILAHLDEQDHKLEQQITMVLSAINQRRGVAL